MPQIDYAGKTDIGLKRTNNEDVLAINSESGYCLAADGMGGAAAGELASKIFAETAADLFPGNQLQTETDAIYHVQHIFFESNQRIIADGVINEHHKGMGCTAELLIFVKNLFVLGHVGDSRTYRWRNDALVQLTTDHTFVQQQVEEGVVHPENVRRHPLRHVIMRAVGLKEELLIDILKGRTLPGDLYLLCSDGLTDMVEDEQLEDILSDDSPLQQKTDALIDIAKNSGGKDNITVVIAAVT